MSQRTPLPSIVEEAKAMVSEATKSGLMLRVLGATAIYIHCPKFHSLFDTLGRRLSDIDFVSYSIFNEKIELFMKQMGYVGRGKFNSFYGKTRLIFDDPSNQRYVDIFFDELRMSHTVRFVGRLELDNPTITITDLLLEKMQIAKINEKDVKDTLVMLQEHELRNEEKDCINHEYIAKQLAGDWGYWFTVTTNLQKTRDAALSHPVLDEDQKKTAVAKLDNLIQRIDSEPKGTRWKMRARIGTKRKWYEEVEEVRR